MKQLLLGAASAAILACASFGVASADPAAPGAPVVASATVSADYTYIGENSGGNSSVNGVGVEGAGIVPFGMRVAGQVDGGYHYLWNSGNASIWNVDGAVMWTPSKGRVGAAVGYDGYSYSSTTLNLVNYGAFADWYASNRFTLAVKGGGANLSIPNLGSASLGYAGGQAVGYITPDFAVSGDVDWLGGDGVNVTVAGVKAEYLVSHKVPVSVFASYDYTNYNFIGNFSTSTVSVGAKFYFGGGGALVDHQRQGVDSWGASSVPAQSVLF